jgi:hypothetical protein
MSNEGEPLLTGAANKNFKPNTYFRGPKEGQPKKADHKDHIERLNESKLENNN